jgi:hypothetical protein
MIGEKSSLEEMMQNSKKLFNNLSTSEADPKEF